MRSDQMPRPFDPPHSEADFAPKGPIQECASLDEAIKLAESALWQDDEGVRWVPEAAYQAMATEVERLQVDASTEIARSIRYGNARAEQALAKLSAQPGAGVEGMSWIVQELSGLESRLAAGDFYSDYDADWERIARLRQCIAALTKEPK